MDLKLVTIAASKADMPKLKLNAIVGGVTYADMDYRSCS
jgi:hypothetical protein